MIVTDDEEGEYYISKYTVSVYHTVHNDYGVALPSSEICNSSRQTTTPNASV